MWTKMFVMFVALLVAIIMGILSIYWGADHSLQFNLPVFTVAIIDFDGWEVGPYLQQMGAAARTANPSDTLGYVSQQSSQYNYSMESARFALKQEHFWFGIVIQSNATTAMNYAYNIGNSSYDPTRLVQLIYEEGRNALPIDEFGLPLIYAFLNDFVLSFAKQKQNSLLTANTGNAAALARQAAAPIPVSFSVFNTAPYVPSTAEAATEIGTICMFHTPPLTATPDFNRSYHHLIPLSPHVQRPQRSNDGQSPSRTLLHLSNRPPPRAILLSLPPLPGSLLRLENSIRQILWSFWLYNLLDALLGLNDGLWSRSRKHQQCPRPSFHASVLRLLGDYQRRHWILPS